MDQQTSEPLIPVQTQVHVQASHAGPSKAFLILLVVILILAVGTGAYFLGQKSIVPVTQPPIATHPVVTQATLMPTPTPDPTANWQTYTNTQYNFLFKYPSTWTVAQQSKIQPDIIRVYCLQCSGVDGFSVKRVPYASFAEYLKSNPDNLNTNPTPYDQQQATVANLPATELLIPPYQGIGLVEYFVVYDRWSFVLTYESYSAATNKIKDLQSPNTDILSTFIFANPNQTTVSPTSNLEGKYCGGIAGETGSNACPSGYICQYPKPVSPDESGYCVKQ